MLTAIKTTLNFSPDFYRKLKQVASTRRKPMNVCIEEIMNPLLDQLHRHTLQAQYEGLFKLKGMIQDGPSDASTTIDEYLYGWGKSSPRPMEEHA